MLKTIAIVVVLLLAAVLIFAATKPETFRVERSIDIKAPPEKIHALIDDFHNFGAWSPWEKLDPGMKRTFSGPAAGKGAIYEWEGNSKVGKGRMEILETTPAKVTIKLDFFAPFEAHNTAEYTFEPKGDMTKVTWAMFGPSPFISKVMSVFVSMDTMVGKDFELGLAQMKTAAEK